MRWYVDFSIERESTVNRTVIVSFLNTALGLWLLSTVAVGLVSTGYSFLTAHLAESAKKNTQIVRLHLEVVQRDVQLASQLGNIISEPNFNEDLPDERVVFAIISYLSPPSVSKQTRFPIYAAFDEYKERPLVSLFIEIKFLVGPDKTSEWDLEGLLSLNEEKLRKMPVKEILKILRGTMDSEYWKDWANKF